MKAGPRDRGDGDRYRRGYGVGYGVGYFGFPYDGTAVVNADSTNEAAQEAQPNAPVRPDYVPDDSCGEAGCPPAENDLSPRRGNNAPEEPRMSAATSAAQQSDGLDHPEVTLVFNDGRPPKKVRSYVLTSSAVFISENGHQTTIPVTDLDMQATTARNRDAGVDFALPGGSR